MSLTRSSAVRAQWRSNVFSNSTITDISPVYIEHDLGSESMHEVAKLRHEQKINFWAFKVSRSIEPLLGGEYRVRFFVEVTYTKWADPSGAAYNAVLDAIEVMNEVVIAQLGSTWGSTVAEGVPQETPPTVSLVDIKGESAFSAQFNYEGFICCQAA